MGLFDIFFHIFGLDIGHRLVVHDTFVGAQMFRLTLGLLYLNIIGQTLVHFALRMVGWHNL